MFRIANYYGDIGSVGRNDGGPLYHTHVLRQIFDPDDVMHLFPMGNLEKYGKFDLHYMVDWGEDGMNMQDFELPHPSVYVTSDTHLGFDYRLSRAKRCDWVFCNQNKAVSDFVAAGIPPDRCFWMPHAFDPLAYSPGIFNTKINNWDVNAVPMNKYDVCFIGNLNDENRVSHLDRLFKEIPNFYWGTQRFHEAAEKFNQSKIVFNVSSRGELNMRHFEALGSGSFLLTDKIAESENVFKDGVHFVGYQDKDDMIDKARYYLEHDEEREKIARAGYLEAISKNTYAHRVLAILDTVGIEYDRQKAEALLPKLEENNVTTASAV